MSASSRKSLSLKRKATPPSAVAPTALPAEASPEKVPRPLGRGEPPVLAVPRHVHELERGTAFVRSLRGKSPLSPLPLGSLPLAPSTLSLLAEQRYNDEFDDEEREPDEDEYVFSVKYQRENGDC